MWERASRSHLLLDRAPVVVGVRTSARELCVVKPHRRFIVALIVMSFALLVALGFRLLENVGISRAGLIPLDAPVMPATVHMGGHIFAVTGAFVRDSQPDLLRLRAWAPTPSLRVIQPGTSNQVTVEIENLPMRMSLAASGPVAEQRDGLMRTLRFSPQATRRLGFTDSEPEVTFAVLGDTGDSPTFIEALHLAASRGADCLIHAGDLIYRDEQMPRIRDILATSPLPVFTVRGNHDYRNAARIGFMRELSPAYYAFRLGGATFIILDNAVSYIPTFWRRSTQYQWLTDVLGMPAEGPVFVVMHKPPFDPRPDTPGHAMEDTGFARALLRAFSGAGVDAVFTGHIHASHRWARDGIPYVISGEGFTSPEGREHNRMAWVHVRGWTVTITHIPIWGTADAGAPRGEGVW
jgi:predicted phosphodiesterase